MKLSPIINIGELLTKKDVVLVDASNSPDAHQKFLEGHLKSARNVDVNTQLSASTGNPVEGGRHPLPPIEEFGKVLASLGIQKDTHVVVYDHQSGANAAARFWWMLRAVGHQNVQVLDGGFQAAIEAGCLLETGEPAAVLEVDSYPVSTWLLPTVDIQEVAEVVVSEASSIIDVRASDRYLGLVEPLDAVAGHIPTTINIPFSTNLDQGGFFLGKDALREKYAALENAIIHCGSGVTACHTILAMDYAGLQVPKLYVGSWSEWSSRRIHI